MATSGSVVFDTKTFMSFCSDLRIDSKEYGLIPMQLTGTQKYCIEEIAKGLNDDIHEFVILKGRQAMISTLCLALDLYWNFRHAGTQGTMVTHTEEARDYFRAVLTEYIMALPKKWKMPIRAHNRNIMLIGNRSKFSYQVAGTRKNPHLGKGKGINFGHMTETASWGDEQGIQSLKESFAQLLPNRLFIWESTALGPNIFMDMWETAKKSHTQRAIFIGWWRNELYQFAEDHKLFSRYWDGEMTSQEEEWAAEVLEVYGHEITPSQIAWWRWNLFEKKMGDMQALFQEQPPCVVAGTRVGTDHGILKIEDAAEGMVATKGVVLETFKHREKKIYKMKTALGYELRASEDHPIFLSSGLMLPIKDVQGQTVKLCPPRFADKEYVMTWKEGPVIHSVAITPLLARFVGIFMGDGSYMIKGHSGVLAVACDAKDMDFVVHVQFLIKEIFGLDSKWRKLSAGGGDIRSYGNLTNLFRRLGIIRNDTGPTLRKVHVPEFIFRSPRHVVKEFLSGLFETDGFQSKDVSRCALFSKYPDFIHDVQLLLLGFGITARRASYTQRKAINKDGTYHDYDANELNLRKQEANLFNELIGFLSERKRNKFVKRKVWGNERTLVMEDRCVEVLEQGYEPVYNLTVENDHAFDANGILTHNTEGLAWQLPGSQFFTGTSLVTAYKDAKAGLYQTFRYHIGVDFTSTDLIECHDETAELKVWDMPKKNGVYVIGADPAYGSSEWADRFVISIWRCFSDRIVQVAEFATPDCQTYQYAWILCHLAGAYNGAMVNLEINGPGMQVWNEMQNLQRQAANAGSATERDIYDVVGSIQSFMYRRLDSIGAGGLAWNWKTTSESKERMLNAMRDYFERKMAVVNSAEAVREMKNIVRVDGSLGGDGRAKDDRVIAAALAIVAWDQDIRPGLMAIGLTQKRSEDNDEQGLTENILSRLITKHMNAIVKTDEDNE